jgi:hypothetical protein
VGVNQYRGALLGSSDASAGPLHAAAYSAADALFHLLIEGEGRPDRFLAAVHKLLWPAPGRDPDARHAWEASTTSRWLDFEPSYREFLAARERAARLRREHSA